MRLDALNFGKIILDIEQVLNYQTGQNYRTPPNFTSRNNQFVVYNAKNKDAVGNTSFV